MTRNRGLVAVLLATLVAAPALAGCLGSAQATAMDQRDPADDRAQQWDEDAQLAKIVGLEGNTSSGSGDGYDGSAAYWEPAREDDSVGDGRIAVWVYVYVSPNEPGKTFVVVVHDGEIEQTEEEDEDEQALPEFSVDSDEAAEIAAENNEGIATAKDSENYGFVYHLETNDDGIPTWFVAGGGGDDDGGGGGFVVIDARNGEVLESRSGSYQDGGSGGWDYGR